ncbi:type III secretion system inner rod subunit SctI [Shewanella sp. 202IG2-18]|uniref:type III secretion system inner rod subunit SctI n=1 Tax=Parashewanella hymeniacidonis TaxID=2807618 RepID=UPI00195F2947|nr:type III secretion system inner rod subunit SctI [Parashewanella hymeniacidonis]MBM7071408.1 type III secretion system inner rod subunit SctI [Parashewanella hymeniacidonis]
MSMTEAVNQVQQIAQNKMVKKEVPEPSVDMVNKFESMMNLGTAQIDQAARVGSVGSDEDLIKKMAPKDKSELDKAGQQLSPLSYLEGQRLIMKGMVEVDLFAKIAGSLSQSINKLASMQ